MVEYIERDKVLALKYWAGEGHIRYGVVDTDDIEKIPAADVAPVRHGRWEYDNTENFWKCSHCGVNAPLQGKFMQLKTKYCPNCGARMGGE